MQWLCEYINALMPKWKVPGLAIAIVKENQVIFSEGFGWRDVDNRLPVTPKTQFAIASCSKAFTTTAMGILVDRGELDWDKPVRYYLPSFKLYDDYASKHLTVRDLVTHQSGLPRHDLMWHGTSFSRSELIDRLQYLEPSQQLHAKYQYQNLMYTTAGYLIGKVTNSSWEEFVKQEIFYPLGMENSNFSVTESQKFEDVALPYQVKGDRLRQMPFLNVDSIAPAGSINSNVTDLSKWLILNLDRGKYSDRQIISSTSLKQIHSPQILISELTKLEEIWYKTYGLGWFIYPYRGYHLIEHGGNLDGFSSLTLLLPQQQIGMVILTNLFISKLPTILAYFICDRLLELEAIDWHENFKQIDSKEQQEKAEQIEKREADRHKGTQPSHPLSDYVGIYQHPGYGNIEIELKEGNLQAIFQVNMFEITHYHYNFFEARSENLDEVKMMSFSSDRQGKISSLSIDLEPKVKEIIFTKNK
jgi:CubicO group peptidase (beta-lactamase class C family)